MTIPDVPWGSRDTSGLAHEQIHRWVHEGADPAALADARDRHAARGEELRAAGHRLDAARSAVGEGWAGRDADAAASGVRGLSDRMLRLGDDLLGQARSLDGVRAALDRVRAAVGPPRGAALGPLGGPASLAELPRAAAGLPVDGFGAFQDAHAEELAARAAYRTYLDETALAARSAPVGTGAGTGGPGGAAGAGGVGGTVATGGPGPRPTEVPGATTGSPRSWSGALARAARGPQGSPVVEPAPSAHVVGPVIGGNGAARDPRPPVVGRSEAFGPAARPTSGPPSRGVPGATAGRGTAGNGAAGRTTTGSRPGTGGPDPVGPQPARRGFAARVAAAWRPRSLPGMGRPATTATGSVLGVPGPQGPGPQLPGAPPPGASPTGGRDPRPARVAHLVAADGDGADGDGPELVVPPVLGVEPDRPRGGPW